MKNNYYLTVKKVMLALFILITNISTATVYYVTQNGSGLQNGSSWANASSSFTLQARINSAIAGDEIWVACGTYLPTTTTNRTISFAMKNGVAIYGGFKGTETSLQQRIHECGSCSILSGEIGNAGNADNSYKVIRNENLNTTAILDGFVIRDGNDNRSPNSSGNGLGGGIYNHGFNPGGSCSPTIQNCIFTNNRASWGAGAFNNGYNGGNSEPVYNNCVFYQNHAYIEAGAMDSYGVAGNASPTIINTIFYENTSDTNVGAMYAWGGNAGGRSNPVLINCVFANNKALNGYGGAFIADNMDENGQTSSGSSTVTLQNCIVWNNTATGAGQQFYRKGNGSQVTATNSTIDVTSQTGSNSLSNSSTNTITSDPLFVDITNAMGLDNCWLTNDDGLRLQSGSTSVNSGSNTNVFATDIVGQPRVSSSIVDRGAYENEATLSAASFGFEKKGYAYPNPIQDFVIIQMGGQNFNTITVQNLLGQDVTNTVSVTTTDSKGVKLDTKNLSKGIYLISVGEIIFKVVKN